MTSVRVLVAGDANLDVVLRGDVMPRFGQAEQLLTAADVVLGSSAGIVACGLARQGVEVDLSARVGDDLFGGEVLRLLTEHGVGIELVEKVDQSTGVSVILSMPDDRAILTHLGAMSSLDGAAVTRARRDQGATHLHAASMFLIPRYGRDLPTVLAQAKADGVTTSLDTNWDPAQRWEGVTECLPFVDIMFPNGPEVVAIARAAGGTGEDVFTAARELARFGPRVAVKDGPAGAILALPNGDVMRAPALEVDVVDTTGAGDSFDAGFIAAWCAGADDETALRRAVAAGSLSTRGAGGTAAQATREEIDAAVRTPERLAG
ncbi:carbohydrate kinase family protein [Microbacterium gorillae]|uniref:carbohydrate kinase family protein n=1 Tax=Microbacterium gorillae TaxID=1231063 RepID=UPI00058B813D|nr:carbohydrate kinase family protein [Microbacterium gorillae]